MGSDLTEAWSLPLVGTIEDVSTLKLLLYLVSNDLRSHLNESLYVRKRVQGKAFARVSNIIVRSLLRGGIAADLSRHVGGRIEEALQSLVNHIASSGDGARGENT